MVVDMIGLKFGRLEVIERAGSDKHGRAMWRGRCTSCGSEVVVRGDNLRNGNTVSDGCVERALAEERTRLLVEASIQKPGSKPKSFWSWRALAQRAVIGVEIDPAWLGQRGYETFAAQMGARPEGASLKRVDASKPYSRANCRWAT
jgi:hypothetical protein